MHKDSRFKIFISIIAFISLTGEVKCQTQNLPAYNHHHIHFGFVIGYNQADFFLQPVPDLAKFDSLKKVYISPSGGFNLGIVTEYKLSDYIKLRFVPDLAFADRQIIYNIQSTVNGSYTISKDIQSVYLDFPVDVKMISKRVGNFEAYVLGGAKYVVDLASQKNVNQSLAGAKATVRIIKNDYGVEAGGGISIYMPYFKFAVEFKFFQGFRNVIVPDNTIFTQSIETLKSKMYLLSFTFEG
jgi:hypothetical protein